MEKDSWKVLPGMVELDGPYDVGDGKSTAVFFQELVANGLHKAIGSPLEDE